MEADQGRDLRWFDGSLTLAVSTPILLEYEEVVMRLASEERWSDIARAFLLLQALYGNVREFDPSYRFNVIVTDPDDNIFVDCAIASDADFVITEDRHFNLLIESGYRPQPIRPDKFIRDCLWVRFSMQRRKKSAPDWV